MTPWSIPSGIEAGAHSGFRAILAAAVLFWSIILATGSSAQPVQEPGHFIRNPAGHRSTIVFEFNGRLWRQEGNSVAKRVTASDDPETGPILSPDGSLVAYAAEIGTSREIFVAALATGETRKLTFDGGFDAKVQGWLGPTEILYSTTVNSAKRGPLLFAVNVATSISRAIPLAEASEGCVLGDQFIYVRNQELIDSNRLYKGGYAQKISRIAYNLLLGPPRTGLSGTNPSIPLTESYAGISRNPLCIGDRIFFLSDRDRRFNIWSMKPDGAGLVQHTFETEYDIRSMTTSDGRAIHYQRAGEIFQLDPAGGPSRRTEINLPPTPGTKTERFVPEPELATEFVVSDDGSRVGLVIRGKLWVVDVGSRSATCAECGSDRRVKSAAMSPDGRTIFALHDASGEYDIYTYDLEGRRVRRVAHAIKEPILDLSASPDSRHILARSVPGGIYHVNAATGATVRLDLGSRIRPSEIAWSRDSRFAAFVGASTNSVGRIAAFDTICGGVTYLTSGRYHVAQPVFSEDGREIYFITNSNLRSSVDDSWGATNYWPAFDNKSLAHAIDVGALSSRRPDAEHSAVSGPPGKRNRRSGCPANPGDRSTSRSGRLLIRELPFVAGNYAALSVSGGRLHAFSKRAARDKWGQIVAFARDLHGGRSAPGNLFDERVFGYSVSAKGRAIVMRTASGLFVSSLAADGEFGPPIPLRQIDGLDIEIDLVMEREQIFNEVWRMHRDYFWDPNMAGLDWESQRKKYRTFLPRVSNRSELGEVVASMVAELGAGHTSLGIPPGDQRGRQGVARLGGDFSDAGTLTVTKIFDGDLDIVEERSPLTAATPPVAIGDRITHVNGTAVASKSMLDRSLDGRVGQPVALRVRTPDGRTVEKNVVPISAGHETWLRNKAWAAGNSTLVEELGGGAVGYIHMPSAYEADFSSFVRQYAHIHQREALIIDLRGNNGGNIDPWLLHFLQRRTWLYVANRYDTTASRHPPESFAGKLIVLIDGDTYSDGELIAEGVRRLDLGILVGTRTSGAGKWVNDDKTLIDGSRVRIPEAGSYFLEGGKARWIIEGTGVEPDVPVTNDPYLFYHGFDAQLRAAVARAMRAK